MMVSVLYAANHFGRTIDYDRDLLLAGSITFCGDPLGSSCKKRTIGEFVMSEVKGFKLVYCDRPARFEIHDLNGGMCSYCYEGNGGAETMAFKFLQAAQSELAALREELDEKGWDEMMTKLEDQNVELRQRLADAERRNADDLRDAERYRKLRTVTPYRFKKMQDASVTDGGDVLYFHSERFDVLMDAVLAKPTESGASE